MTNRSRNPTSPANARPQYMHIEDVEPFERYGPGGYYPARIGERISRYRILHKLGHGTSSTTWLAWDERSKRYVAIKIAIATANISNEREILNVLTDQLSKLGSCSSSYGIQSLLDDFEIQCYEIEGQRGMHRCLVTVPARMSISEAREASCNRLFQLPVARAIAAQVLQAVTFLHSSGVVHSDLHEGNVLLQLPTRIDNLSQTQLYDQYGQPELEVAARCDRKPLDEWVPTHGVVPIWFGISSEDVTLADSKIILIDYSESSRPAVTPRYESHTPYALRSPELLIGPSRAVSYPSDVWALACFIFAILGQRPLFDTWFPGRDRIIEEHVDTLGRLPHPWWTQWTERGQSFDENLKRIDGGPRRTLEVRFDQAIQEPRQKCGMELMGEEEKTALLSLLRSMLTFEPEKRISVEQVLDSKWVTRWADPALKEAH